MLHHETVIRIRIVRTKGHIHILHAHVTHVYMHVTCLRACTSVLL